VGVPEHTLVLDAKADERVDIEKPSVSEFPSCRLPVSQPVVLLRQNRVEGVRVGIDSGQRCVDRVRDVRVGVAKLGEVPRDNFFVSMPAFLAPSR
jgi:hypothetical protein